jgi:molybdopterin/thiamine biosynthesis adenylyltransferase
MLRFDRITHLLSPEELRDKLVVQVGVGSGGAPVNDHLTMNGVRRWVLFDPDTYDDINLVKHPRPRGDLGALKVENQRRWILDRNPSAEVTTHAEDVMTSTAFREAVKAADLVLCCTDTQAARSFVNTIAVEEQRPCVTASVFRQGFGGEVYSYLPGVSGCFDCMSRVATEQGWNIDDSIEPLPVEEEAVYGLNLRDFKASGLSMDIQSIAIIQARAALDCLLSGTERRFAALPANWIIFYNRPVPGTQASGFLKSTQFKVKARQDCACKTP